MNKIWYLGDSILAPSLQQLAIARNVELIDSSVPNASMEEVWVVQSHENKIDFRQTYDVIIFVNSTDYDAEVLIRQVLNRIEPNRIVLIVYPANSNVAEGMEAHWQGDKFKTVKVDSLENITAAIQTALE